MFGSRRRTKHQSCEGRGGKRDQHGVDHERKVQRGATYKTHPGVVVAQLRIQGVKLEVGRGPEEVEEVSWAYAEAARRTARVIFLENIIREMGTGRGG